LIFVPEGRVSEKTTAGHNLPGLSLSSRKLWSNSRTLGRGPEWERGGGGRNISLPTSLEVRWDAG
jgi:hypothetical protein